MGAHLITGGAGFIGTNLSRRLCRRGAEIIIADDLSGGASLDPALRQDARVHIIDVDCADAAALHAAIAGLGAGPIDDVWHLAANSDIAAGTDDLRVDLQRTFLTTTGILLLLRDLGPARIHFASSSAVYGDHGETALTEDAALRPISFYGAMKLASEAQIRAAVESFLPQANIHRFANIIGTPATHGVIFDFVRRLAVAPDRLVVLGDGTQRKPYLHVDELVDAMLFIAGAATGRCNVFNIGPADDGVTVAEIAEMVAACVAPGARLAFGTEPRGWVGDVPRFRFSTARLAALGWSPKLGSREAVRRAVTEIVAAGI